MTRRLARGCRRSLSSASMEQQFLGRAHDQCDLPWLCGSVALLGSPL